MVENSNFYLKTAIAIFSCSRILFTKTGQKMANFYLKWPLPFSAPEFFFYKNQGKKWQIFISNGSSHFLHKNFVYKNGVENGNFFKIKRRLLPYVIAKFFQGGYRTKMKIWSDENEKLVGKFFARLRRAKKGIRKFFACGGLFSLWRH